jgi:N-acetylmuramoyl-L-alanine amidase
MYVSAMVKKTLIFSIAATAAIIVSGCSASKSFPDYASGVIPMYEQPSDWKDIKAREEIFKTYTKYLTGRKIFLDPGHGGADRKNKSRSGKIVEADVNLNVAKHLKAFLEKTGAVVFMSRVEDSTVDLKARSEIANKSGAEIFISIHHNAGGNAEDYSSDYTSTYYHSNEEYFNYEPCCRDLARYIQRDLSYAVRNSGGLGSFDGTYSDYIIYPREGYSVLRNSKMPAVLVECAFHTSRLEEVRLGFEEYNEIEAWGIYKGIAKYFRSGIPIIKYEDAISTLTKDNAKLVFTFEDKTGIDEKTIQVYKDSVGVPFNFNKNINILEVPLQSISSGEHTIRVIAANKNKNYSFPFYKTIKIE